MRAFLNIPLTVLVFMTVLAGPLWSSQPEEMLTLEESIAIATRQSLSILSAQEGFDAVEAQRKEAFTAFLPTVSTSYSYTLLNRDPHSYFQGFPPLVAPGYMIVGTRDNYTWAFDIKQPLFAGGAIRENYALARLGVDIADFETQACRLDTILQVKTAYFSILKSERMLDVARQSEALLRAHLDNTQGFYDVQMIARNDLLRAEVELANGRKYALHAANAVDMAKSQFNIILRRPINAAVEVQDTMNALPPVPSLDECLKEAEGKRPEIKAAELKLRQGQSAVRIARSGYYPSLNAVGHFQRFGDKPDVAGTLYQDKESWYVSAAASWTFWEWGRTKDRVDAGKARVNQMEYALAEIRDQVRLEVKRSWLELKDAEEQVSVTFKAIAQAEENFRISQERYKEQVGTATEVLDAQTLLTRAKADYANALGDYQIAYARLERAMGSAR